MPPGATMRMYGGAGGGAPAPAPAPKAKKSSSGKSTGGKATPPPRKSRWWVRLLKWGFGLGFLGLVIGIATIAIVFWAYGRDPKLPDGDQILKQLTSYKPKQVTTILDTNDQRIGELFSERRTYVPIEKIPPLVADAFVAAEDNTFWQHDGIDYRGMVRALVKNVRAGHTKEGASTITQQLVKNLLLTPERTFKRKVQEIILARRMEKVLTKQQILNVYLNAIYFGGGRYGVEEAARYYFGKGIADVNVGEAAMLASLPKSPEGLSPSKEKNRDRLKVRQGYVLDQLVKMGKLTVAESDRWKAESIKIVKTPFPEMNRFPEWIDPVRMVLEKEKGKEAIDTLGAKVRTTLDPTIQGYAQDALRKGLRGVDARHHIGRPIRKVKADKIESELARLAKKLPSGGPAGHEIYEAVVVEVHDDDKEVVVDLGNYKASLMLGGPEDARFNHESKQPSERFAPGDVVQVMGMAQPKGGTTREDGELIEPGDTAPVVAGAKHAKHRVQFSPGAEGAVVIIDIKTRKVRALVGGYTSKVAGFDRAIQAKRQPGSSFKPYVYATAMDMYTGIKLGGKYTPGAVVNDAPEKFDLWKPKNFEAGKFEGPVRIRKAFAKSINTVAIRVAYDVTPDKVAEMAKAMGITNELPHEISLALGSGEVTPLEHTNALATLAAGGIAQAPRFVDAIDGKAMPAPPATQALRPEVAYVTVDMMRSVVEEGTATVVKQLGIPVAGKTGTSNDARDVWFVGLTPDYAIGIWIGFDDNRPMGGKETGGGTAAPIFVDVLKEMKLPKKAFARPANVVEITIDKESGLVAPEGAPKGSTMSEVFVKGTEPTEVAAKPGEITDETAVKSEYED